MFLRFTDPHECVHAVPWKDVEELQSITPSDRRIFFTIPDAAQSKVFVKGEEGSRYALEDIDALINSIPKGD